MPFVCGLWLKAKPCSWPLLFIEDWHLRWTGTTYFTHPKIPSGKLVLKLFILAVKTYVLL